jgi:hypothetical protein
MTAPVLRLFLDRSIGTKVIASAIRELGLDVQTIQDRYGDESPTIADARSWNWRRCPARTSTTCGRTPSPA